MTAPGAAVTLVSEATLYTVTYVEVMPPSVTDAAGWLARYRDASDGDRGLVRFELLHPEAGDYARIRKSNDLSCVLKVTAAGRSLLLASDIEARAESALLARGRERLQADVLLVPHHGSRTSSMPEFVAAVGARDVIFPVGYRNRFGHPKAEVVARYDGARQWRSDRDGAVSVQLGGAGVTIATERAGRRRYWHGS